MKSLTGAAHPSAAGAGEGVCVHQIKDGRPRGSHVGCVASDHGLAAKKRSSGGARVLPAGEWPQDEAEFAGKSGKVQRVQKCAVNSMPPLARAGEGRSRAHSGVLRASR